METTILIIGIGIILGIVTYNLCVKQFIKDPIDDFGEFFKDNFNN